MQTIKDSFYCVLRDRLAALNPLRTVTVNGATRTALMVQENEAVSAAPLLAMAFFLQWGEAQYEDRRPQPLISVECLIRYAAEGTPEISYQDRGRMLGELSQELLTITFPQNAALMDHSQQPPAETGAQIFWSRPILGATELTADRIVRTARLRVFAATEAAF